MPVAAEQESRLPQPDRGRFGEVGELAVVTHGVLRRILARQLEARGWRPDGMRRSYAHWSVWTLRKTMRTR